ncbi:4Fe-4S dicluster domain-containing protein [Candidatus Hecatella orcuttiae]|jgi:Fe-S-cluster-containing hydrogenase component 2|uniref:4Fe-4S dicluster domain-containing protein n=1 Tax=Candidatus Hecatella orcuttiae TaxID=1935119 RepID=UPI002867E588|nr:4Fe-4S dicluster domain-containing protein [Candidatus Hecatella orcuttiae]
MERSYVVASPEKCTGCRICELICSAVKEGKFNPLLSRIKTVRIVEAEAVGNMALACKLCENPPCVESCPLEALTKDPSTGIIIVDDEKCTGCGLCIDACDIGALTLHPDRKVVVVCDLCGGDPACIKACPKEALELTNLEALSARSQEKELIKLLVNNVKKPRLR